MQGRLLTITMLALTGCAATSEPVLDSAPIDVTREELVDYWVPATQGGNFVKAPTTREVPCAVVEFRQLIDSNGQVHDFEVIDSMPRGRFNSAARELAESIRYAPASGNASRVPVRVRNYVTFDMNSEDDIDCDAFVRERFSRAE